MPIVPLPLISSPQGCVARAPGLPGAASHSHSGGHAGHGCAVPLVTAPSPPDVPSCTPPEPTPVVAVGAGAGAGFAAAAASRAVPAMAATRPAPGYAPALPRPAAAPQWS